jgi:uracil-DNA glycosylase family 4
VNNKNKLYQDLVKKRKTCDSCVSKCFKNQSETKFDTNEIGNWTTWANDLDADIMIIGQDYANESTFNKDLGRIETKELTNNSSAIDYTTVTNYYLRELTKFIGFDIMVPPDKLKREESNGKVFLTNSVLCLKAGSMSKSIPQSVYEKCGEKFLKPTIDIVKPKVIITLGATATKAVITAYSATIGNSKELLRSNFKTIFNNGAIEIKDTNMIIAPVYHTGILGQNNRKKIDTSDNNKFDLMKEDWAKIKELI